MSPFEIFPDARSIAIVGRSSIYIGLLTPIIDNMTDTAIPDSVGSSSYLPTRTTKYQRLYTVVLKCKLLTLHYYLHYSQPISTILYLTMNPVVYTSFLWLVSSACSHDKNRFWTSCFLLCCSTNLESYTYSAIRVSPSLDSFKRYLKAHYFALP